MSASSTRSWVLILCACSTAGGTVNITLGGESDTLTRDPAVVALRVDTLDRSGNRTTLVAAQLPATTVDLGAPSGTLVASIQVTGLDSSNNEIAFGATPFIEMDNLSGGTIPLMVQRKGEFARMPGTLPDGRAAPVLTASTRSIYFAGGDISGSQDPPALGGYDMAVLTSYSTCGAEYSAGTAAFIQLGSTDSDGDSAIVLTIASGGAATIGLTTCANDPIGTASTTSIDWSTIAGANVVIGADAKTYVVGPTKPDTVSSVILIIDPNSWDADAGSEAATLVYLSTGGRQGAAAAWAPNRGVAIYGGGGGVDILPSGSPTSYPIPFPAVTESSLAMIALDDHTMLVAGDAASPRTLDLSCSTATCAPEPWGQALPFALASPSIFNVGSVTFLIVGDDAQGTTHAFRLTSVSTTEVPFKIARHQARAIQFETGLVVVIGGGTTTPESYAP